VSKGAGRGVGGRQGGCRAWRTRRTARKRLGGTLRDAEVLGGPSPRLHRWQATRQSFDVDRKNVGDRRIWSRLRIENCWCFRSTLRAC